MNPEDAINASAARIIMLRGGEMRLRRIHTCRPRDCHPLCEMDLINDGRLSRAAKVIDSRVYVCVYHQIHVCCPDRCRDYLDRADGVCPVSGLSHGQSEGNVSVGYVPPEKRTARFKPGLNVLKRATAVPPEPLTIEEQYPHLYAPQTSETSPKHRKIQLLHDNGEVEHGADTFARIKPGTSSSSSFQDEEEEDLQSLPMTIFTNAVATRADRGRGGDSTGPLPPPPPPPPVSSPSLPESGFYSFGSTVVKKTNKQSKRGARVGSAGNGMRKKPIPMQRRRDEAELIVTQLLYSSTRKAICKEKKDRLANDKLKALSAYYKERMGVTFPVMVEVEGIKAIYDVDIPTLRVLKRDEARIVHYVDIIVRTWDIVTKTPWGAQNPGYKFVAHALSVLYKMRSGMKLNNLQLLPHDSYLFALPIRGDLWRYNEVYNSSIVTEGMKHIRSAYESALAAGWSPSALSLDTL